MSLCEASLGRYGAVPAVEKAWVASSRSAAPDRTFITVVRRQATPAMVVAVVHKSNVSRSARRAVSMSALVALGFVQATMFDSGR